MTGTVGHEPVIEKADLHKILANRARLDVIVVRLGNATKEVHGVGIAEVIVEGLKDKALSAQDFGLAETVIGDMAEVGNMRRQDFLIL